MLDGLEKLKTPFSDHAHDITAALTADITISDREHTRLFETFEILAALAFLTMDATKEQFEEAHADQNQRNFIWAPVGRAGWDGKRETKFLPT